MLVYALGMLSLLLINFVSAGKVDGRTPVLVLDLDGTLYEDDMLIETQIRDNCHIWGKDFDLTPDRCQEMHEKYGSTIFGVLQELNQPFAETVTEYYNRVYPFMDMRRLRKYSFTGSTDDSGYSHNSHDGDLLRSLHDFPCEIVIASNSPIFHVKRCLTRLGIANLNVSAFITPERVGGILKTDERFWKPLFDLYPKDSYQCTLIDDNGLNIEIVRSLGMHAHQITPTSGLKSCLLKFLGIFPSSNDAFQFDEAKYLKAKNEVDQMSLNKDVLERLQEQVHSRLASKIVIPGKPACDTGENTMKLLFRTVDLGAGLLNMLPTVSRILKSTLKKVSDEQQDMIGGKNVVLTMEYVAFESNENLSDEINKTLENQGFLRTKQQMMYNDVPCDLFESTVDTHFMSKIYVVRTDFMSEDAIMVLRGIFAENNTPSFQARTIDTPSTCIDLFVGCCVADLISPRALAAQLLEMANDNGGIIYLPITFCGQTSLCGNLREEESNANKQKDFIDRVLPVPSSEIVFNEYHKYLKKCSHHMSPDVLINTFEEYGCRSTLSPSCSYSSSWTISKKRNAYMFQCLMHFVASGVTLPLLRRWNIQKWLHKVQADASSEFTIVAKNVDLLLSLPQIPQNIAFLEEKMLPSDPRVRFAKSSLEVVDKLRSTPSLHEPETVSTFLENENNEDLHKIPQSCKVVEFSGNRNLHIIEEEVPQKLEATQVLIQTHTCLISPGTELKIFQGDVDTNQAVDLTIEQMKDKGMQYPMRYGYSLTGKVVKVGEAVDTQKWLGKKVFTFSNHADAVIVDAKDLLPIPEGISCENAVFLPAMETAVSLAMAARPLIGERVAIFGQGIIGQLTGAVIDSLHEGDVEVTLFDVNEKRLDIAKEFIPNAEALNPVSSNSMKSDFDVCIEVTGHPQGLQGAIDKAGKNGRIIVGSLYGEKDVLLKLGMEFHRSGKTLQTSQVSDIPSELKARWSKERRFDVSWNFIRRIQPVRLLRDNDEVLEGENEYVVAPFDAEILTKVYKKLEKGEMLSSLIQRKDEEETVFTQDGLAF